MANDQPGQSSYSDPFAPMPEPVEYSDIKRQENAAPADEVAGATYGEEDVPVLYYCMGWFLILVVLAGIAFGVWWFFIREQEDDTAQPPATDEETEVEDENTVGPAGGTVRSPDGAVVIVPKGALDAEVEIKIEKVATGGVTNTYHLKPDGTIFKKPVTVVIPYRASGLAKEQTPYDIYLAYSDYRYSGYEEVTTAHDLESETLSTRVSRF